MWWGQHRAAIPSKLKEPWFSVARRGFGNLSGSECRVLYPSPALSAALAACVWCWEAAASVFTSKVEITDLLCCL